MIPPRPGVRWREPAAPEYDNARVVDAIRALVNDTVPPALELAQLAPACDGIFAVDFLQVVACGGANASGPFVLANRRYGVPTLVSTYLGRPFMGTGGEPVVVTEGLPTAVPTILRIWAGTSGPYGTIKTTDAGLTWRSTGSGSPSAIGTIGIAASNKDLLLQSGKWTVSGTDYLVSLSSDRGETWTLGGTGFLSSTGIEGLAIHPTDPSIVYAAANRGILPRGSCLFKSTDGGATFTASGPAGDKQGRAVAIAPSTPSTVYVGTSLDKIYVSYDSGGTWVAAATGLPAQAIVSIAIDPVTNTTLYCAPIYNNVYKSTNGGGTWASSSTGLTASGSINAIAVNPGSPNIVYAGDGQRGIFRSMDYGANWYRVSACDLSSDEIYDIQVDRLLPNLVVAAGRNGLFFSSDYGATWSALLGGTYNPGGLPQYRGLAIDSQR